MCAPRFLEPATYIGLCSAMLPVQLFNEQQSCRYAATSTSLASSTVTAGAAGSFEVLLLALPPLLRLWLVLLLDTRLRHCRLCNVCKQLTPDAKVSKMLESCCKLLANERQTRIPRQELQRLCSLWWVLQTTSCCQQLVHGCDFA